MNDWLAPTVILGLLGIIATYTGVVFTRRNNKDTLLLSSRDDHIDDLREDLKGAREELRSATERLDALEGKVQEQSDRIKDLEVREWSLRRYVYLLIDRIRELGGEPPEPPENLKL